MKNKLFLSAVSISVILAQSAFSQVVGDIKSFTSSNGVNEKCVAIQKFKLGKYSAKDLEKEQELCSIDLYNNTVALCPKTWSTSPGTIVNNIAELNKTSSEVEENCNSKANPLKSIAKFKTTMNGPDTSATYSTSSLLYYHFSRALETTVDVPVSVYRSIDKKVHYDRVSSKANPSPKAKQNYAAWEIMRNAENGVAAYPVPADFYTDNGKQIYGVLLKDKGERYGAEINGTRESGWGIGQNLDFQKTPAFLGLQSTQDFQEAITEGYLKATADSVMKAAFASGKPSNAQMALWMREVSEIVILDYIFSQQDRVGNIDFVWHWVYVDEAGQVKAVKDDSEVGRPSMNKIKVPDEIAKYHPILIQKTAIGDNDAGALPQYANYTKMSGMVDGIPQSKKLTQEELARITHEPIHHLHPKTYQNLISLAKDFAGKGENYQILASSYGLNSSRLNGIITNTLLIAKYFQTSCKSGSLKLDIADFKNVVKGDYSVEPVSCD